MYIYVCIYIKYTDTTYELFCNLIGSCTIIGISSYLASKKEKKMAAQVFLHYNK